jgi:uncharacterized membrane protein
MNSNLRERLRRIVRILVVIAMVAVGITHFTNPDPFVRIMPAFLPAKLELVWLSGAIEIGLGLMLLPKPTRRLASYGLVLLFLAVFPANINMAINQVQLNPESPLPVWAMWARLPFQLLFIAAALFVGRDGLVTEAEKQPR